MSISAALIVAAPVLPLLLAASCVSTRLLRHLPVLLILAPLPAMATALIAVDASPMTIRYGIVPITLALDLPGAMLLGTASLLWIAAAAYAAANRSAGLPSARFAVCWLLTLAGSIGVFITADLASFFLAYALVSIPAYGLIVHDDTSRTLRAGTIYMAFTVLGETVLLMAFVLLAAGSHDGGLMIRGVMAALPNAPWRGAALALLIAGFGMKIALVPLHVWMPLAYRAAPISAAAVLSGAAVKAGIIGLIRFLPLGFAIPDAGNALAAVGLLGAFYGVAVGLTQSHPKTVLAYSSISQMGLIATVLGAGLAAGDARAGLAAAFYAAHHVLAKGALFLAIGAAATNRSSRLLLVLLPAAVLALGLGGLPLTGGALAKLAVKGPLGDGAVPVLANLSAAGSTMLMLHFLWRLAAVPSTTRDDTRPSASTVPWLALAIATVAIPWALYPLAGGTWAETIAPAALWDSLWPVLLGTALAIALSRLRSRLPCIPEGDILAACSGVAPTAIDWGGAIERWEGKLRAWPVASLSLVAIAVLLGLAMSVAR